jgi:hypothetical protein
MHACTHLDSIRGPTKKGTEERLVPGEELCALIAGEKPWGKKGKGGWMDGSDARHDTAGAVLVGPHGSGWHARRVVSSSSALMDGRTGLPITGRMEGFQGMAALRRR